MQLLVQSTTSTDLIGARNSDSFSLLNEFSLGYSYRIPTA